MRLKLNSNDRAILSNSESETLEGISKHDIRSLATRYSTLNEVMMKGNDNGVLVWARMLQETQKKIGIVMYSDETLDNIISEAEVREAKTGA